MPGKTNNPKGRPKGSKNKTTLGVQEKLAAMGCDPIEGMAKIAAAAYEENNHKLAGDMYKELAQYVAPKRKAIEVSGNDGGPLVVQVVRFADNTDS